MRITLGYLKMIVYMFFELDLIKDEPLVHFLGFAHLVKTLDGTNEPDTGRQAPEMKMYFLLKMGIFQPAMLVYRSVFIEFQAELWSALKWTTFPRLLLIPHELACEKSCLLKPQRKERTDEHPLSNTSFQVFFVAGGVFGEVYFLQKALDGKILFIFSITIVVGQITRIQNYQTNWPVEVPSWRFSTEPIIGRGDRW